MKLIVDRIEGELVVCEIYGSNDIVSIKSSAFPKDILSGDLFEFDGNVATKLENDFMSKRIQKKMNNLWK